MKPGSLDPIVLVLVVVLVLDLPFLSGRAKFVGLSQHQRTENDDEDEHDLGVLEDPPHPAKLFVALVQKVLD